MRGLLLLIFCFLLRASAATVVVTVGQNGNFFSPVSFTINPGDTVTWIWMGGHHNTVNMSRPAGALGWSANIDATTTTYSYVAQVSGLYKYTCTHHSGMDGAFFVRGCNYPARPSITAQPAAVFCKGDSIILYATKQPGATYIWTESGFLVAGATADSLVVRQPGNYKVVVNHCGADSASNDIIITNHPSPRPSYTASASGLSYVFTNTTPGLAANSYSWTFSDGSPAQTGLNATHSFAAPGAYTVMLKATEPVNNCTGTISQKVQAALDVRNIEEAACYVYPNPADNFVNINTDAPVRLWLRDIYGATIKIPAIVSSKGYVLDVSAVHTGIYQLIITSSKGTTIAKLGIMH